MSSKALSKLGVTVSSDLKKLPVILYTPPSCVDPSYDPSIAEDMCEEGSYSGFVLDLNCACSETEQHTFTVTNTTVDDWTIDYLGGDTKPNIISSNNTTLVIDFSTPAPIATAPLYCNQPWVRSVFEVTASHEFSKKTFRVTASECWV